MDAGHSQGWLDSGAQYRVSSQSELLNVLVLALWTGVPGGLRRDPGSRVRLPRGGRS